MSPLYVSFILVAYFGMLILIARKTKGKGDNSSFFIGDKNSPWYLVAFGMIGASLSGVTFISIPGAVGSISFSYMQIVLGYLLGYFIIATVLMPLYYKLNLISIYTYLEERFGPYSYKTGAWFFLISRIIGSAFRLYLVARVLQLALFADWGVPFWVSALFTLALIWVYSSEGGIKTIVWTDTLQTAFMLGSVGLTIYIIAMRMNMSTGELFANVLESDYSRMFFFDDWRSKHFFPKEFLSGVFIALVMTGLDQDMMQKNLSCRNLKDAQKNMFSFSLVLTLVNFIFLVLGGALYLYANSIGFEIPSKTDDLFPSLAMGGYLGIGVAICFLLGLIAAAYSSADSALTALTTSFCIDILEVSKHKEEEAIQMRKRVHIAMTAVLFLVIIAFNYFVDESVINMLFVFASYTYGPLLGLFAFGIFSKKTPYDKLVPLVAILSPLISYFIKLNSPKLFWGYEFGFELLIVNGFTTYLGLSLLSVKAFKT